MIITKQADLDARISALQTCEFITVDTEFLREKTYYPKLCLIQVSGPDKDAFAIDPIGTDLDLEALYELFQKQDVLKIFHAARQDLEIFFNLTGKVVSPFFDTQIAAMVCGYGDQIGYENLVRNITGQSVDKSSQFTDWSRRPLTDKQLNYALGDVTHLCDVYLSLSAELKERGRTEWVYEEESVLQAPETYENDPYNVWQRIKIKSPKPRTLAVLRELAAWREAQAQKRDMPRGWVMRDDTLADMAAQAPKDKVALKKIRGMSADAAENKTGEALLRAIDTALKSDQSNWPAVNKKKQIPSDVAPVIDILKMLLKIQASLHEVAPKLIASPTDLEAIALNPGKTDLPPLKGWRHEVFGREALALIKGELAIGMKDNEIVKYDVTSSQKMSNS